MSQIIAVRAEGSGRDVKHVLAQIRAQLGLEYAVIWQSARWEPADFDSDTEAIEDDFEIEIYNVERRIDALDRVQRAVDAVDPEGLVIKPGLDLAKTFVPS